MHFDLTDLRLIVRVAEANSLTGGAEASHISLPAASTRIKNLEESVGAKLLYRTSTGVTLTPPGQAFVYHARLVLSQIEQLRSDLEEYAKGVKGHVRILSNTTAMEFLPSVLRAYLVKHPDVNVDLRERLSYDTVRAVFEGRTDIGIVAATERTDGLEVVPYRKDWLVLALPRTHALAACGGIAFAQTLDFDHVGLFEASALHSYLRQMAERIHRRMNLRIQVGNFESVCRMIGEGVGIGIVPRSVALRHAQSMPIAVVPLSDPWAQRAQLICVRSLAALPGFARDLIDMLVEDAASDESPSAG